VQVVSRLPSFKSIEAFVVAAQSLSFTDAAVVLNITVPAVSRRIQALEMELGITLFQRTARSLKLTAIGADYVKQLLPAIENIRQASEHVRSKPVRNVVRICVRPFFAASWLFPRLYRFNALHPNIQIEYETSNHEIDFGRNDADVAIFFGNGTLPGLHSALLLNVTCFPLCSARFRDQANFPDKLNEVVKYPLIESAHEPELWSGWLRAAGLAHAPAHQMIHFDNLQLCYEAALNDLGIAIGLDVFSEPYLRERKLVRPFKVQFTPQKQFYAVCRPHDRDRPAVNMLMKWLMQEASDWQKNGTVAYDSTVHS
jgi:LysR family transcriptional regulator, glycine cleavage system transcriptional activator